MHTEPRRFDTYEETLSEFLREELEGETYFERLADFFEGERREAFLLIAKMETVCVRAFDPVLARLGLEQPDVEAAHRAGLTQAEACMDKSWEDHLEEMAFEFDVYLEEFRIGAALGPAQDQPFHDLLYAHEVAMIEFAKRALHGAPDPLEPLKGFLARYA